MNRSWLGCIALLLLTPTAGVSAADGSSGADMPARYARAAEIQQARSRHWLLNQWIVPHWIPGRDAFWYQRQTIDGHRFVRVDAATGGKVDAFDHARLARELGAKIGKPLREDDLPLAGLTIESLDGPIRFSAFGKAWRFDPARGLNEDTTERARFAVSPDGRLGVFTKADNLWLRDLASGAERRLTQDGTPHHLYGANPEARPRLDPAPGVLWSPDSRHIFTVQTDDRDVLDSPVVDFAPVGAIRPEVVHYRMALPGDQHVPTFRLTLIDVANGSQTPVRYPALPAVRMEDSPVDSRRMWWSANGKTAYFIDVERGEKAVHVNAVNAATGATRTLFSETSDTSIELGSDVYSPAMVRYLPKSNRLIWYSERSGWAHLYLYDLATGKLIRPLTRGNWLVRSILGVDEDKQQLFVSLAGRTAGKNPYYQEIARVDLSSNAMTILSASDDEHYVVDPDNLNDGETIDYIREGGDRDGMRGLAPSGDYFVETVVTAATPARTLLRDRTGKLVATVETADASRMPSWWRWPKPVELLAADGKTRTYGLVFRPSDYSAAKRYPVVDYVYGGPQAAYVPKGFGQGEYQDAASLAELGFVTLMIDGRGTVQRSHAFHAESYGRSERASDLEDHIAAIRQLAAADPAIDAIRVGITGFSAGGYLTANALLRYPDFYSVGVAMSGSHDLRLFWGSWGERYEGYPVGANYGSQANLTYASHLKGRLMLMHGLMDTAVSPGNMFQLEQALIDANRDFDTLVWPREAHSLPSYGKRRQWDYFVEHLAHDAPPPDFLLRTDDDIESGQIGPAGGGR